MNGESTLVEFGPFLIPITMFLGGFAVGIVAIVMKQREKENKHRERMFLAEKGLPIPPELYEVPQPSKPNGGYRAGRAWLLIFGFLGVAIGLGIMITLTVREGFDQGVGGLIGILIGLAFLAAERMIARMAPKPDDL